LICPLHSKPKSSSTTRVLPWETRLRLRAAARRALFTDQPQVEHDALAVATNPS
jgi:hypothetical protein